MNLINYIYFVITSLRRNPNLIRQISNIINWIIWSRVEFKNIKGKELLHAGRNLIPNHGEIQLWNFQMKLEANDGDKRNGGLRFAAPTLQLSIFITDVEDKKNWKDNC